ncbi:hypothetical protein J2M53_10855 [Arthrobacter sp. zg-ZUI100]|nr:hypothetical protein [Arthrobacter jiangjiafuii]MBP3036742.1 hypothetical protein [Arthrobacter jiangjiafuii]
MDTLNLDPTPLPGSSGIPQLRFHDALPLRLAGVDGSPVRAAAFQL